MNRAVSPIPRAVVLLVASAGCLSLAAAIFSGCRWLAATAARDDARVNAANTAAMIMEIKQLRAQRPSAAEGPPPEGATLSAITAAVRDAGLPAELIRRHADTPAERVTDGVERAIFTATLAPVDPPTLGRFLAAWHTRHPEWTVAAIDLRRAGDAYTATLRFAATYRAGAAQ